MKQADEFRAAWKEYGRATDICNLGKIEFMLKRPRDAAENLSTCLRVLPQRERDVFGKSVERDLKKARALVGELKVISNVPDAEIVVDGTVVGMTPMDDPIFLKPGRYGVEVRAPGYTSDAKIAQLAAGTSMAMKMVLEPAAIEVAPVSREQAPPAPKATAEAPAPAPPPAPAEVERRPLKVVPVPVPSGDTKGAETPRAAVLIAGFGLGVAGVGVAVGGFVGGDNAREDAARRRQKVLDDWYTRPCTATQFRSNCTDLDSTIADAATLTAVGVGGVLLGAVGGALFVYELARSSSHEKKASLRASVTAAPSGGALTITGNF